MSDREKVDVKCHWCNGIYKRHAHHHKWSVENKRDEFCCTKCHSQFVKKRAIFCRLNPGKTFTPDLLKTQSYSCKFCDKEHDGSFASGVFCCTKCARSFSSQKTEAIKIKIGNSNRGRFSPLRMHPSEYYLHKKCLLCDNLAKPKHKFCSMSCAAKGKWLDEDYRNNIIQQKLDLVASGKHQGWPTRKKLYASYPEQFTMKFLENNSIEYEREFKCGKYFIDFAIHDLKIALEVDGKQHDYPERKAKDLEKTEFLSSKGWKVFRIRWYNPINEEKKLKMKVQLDSFLEFLEL